MSAFIDLNQIVQIAKQASYRLRTASTAQKNLALEFISEFLNEKESVILEENQEDLNQAQLSEMSEALQDRLSLKGRLEEISQDVLKISRLPDLIGEPFDQTLLPNGLNLSKCRVPIGVIGVIYEARPNVTVDIASLTIKTGNSVILRGGSETRRSNRILVQIIQDALKQADLPTDAVQLIDSPDRTLIKELLTLHRFIDLIIPRGGEKLQRFCRDNSTIPVIFGGIGICHLYADETVDQERALPLIANAKTQRPTVCNSLDTLLVHRSIASSFIPKVIERLSLENVAFRVDEDTWELMNEKNSNPSFSIQPATQSDWNTEWLNLTLGIKIVENLEDALAHIQAYSTGHSDGILTTDQEQAKRFVQQVDSAAVYVNASTRFTDGGQFGLGAEVAVSTQKLHARGPMGLKELTTYKWVVYGDYHIRT